MDLTAMEKFLGRHEAGKILATHLNAYHHQENTIVLGLPRGGVPVAYEIAKALHLPLDIWLVRKLGFPGQEELAIGAISSGESIVYNQEVLEQLLPSSEKPASDPRIENIITREKQELNRRLHLYRGPLPPLHLLGKTVILVDDGIATGASMRVAIQALRTQKPKKLIIAVPVAEPHTANQINALVDEFYCLLQPKFFLAVGSWYEDFSQTTDQEVNTLLAEANHKNL